MSSHAVEVWRHAPSILAKLEVIIGLPKAAAKKELMTFLGAAGGPADVVSVDDAKPGVEDFEYALHSAALDRLETDGDEKVEEVAAMLDVTAAIVVEFFEQAARPGMPQAETDRCKSWWSMLLGVAEDVSRLIPIRFLERLVQDWEQSLVQLRAAYLKLAMQRLSEFDAKQEADQKKAEEAEKAARESGGDPKSEKEKKAKEAKEAKEAKDKETKRTEERKKMIATLGISPNGQLYLTLTSLLKQLCSRLCSSLHAPLRARIVLLLEQLLAMDHKAIANNQKLRTQDLAQASDLDAEPESVLPSRTAAAEGSKGEAAPPAAAEAAGATPAGAAAGAAPQGLGSDPAVDAKLYKSFWGLQEYLHSPEKLFETADRWASFHIALSELLALFLKYPVQDDSQQPWSEPEPAPLRHAPRARALTVQLEDPGFRQQFLTQVMIAFQALEQDGSSRRGDGSGIISRQPELVRSEFHGLKKICEMVLSQTRKGFPSVLKHMLDRESHWVLWKVYGCQEFERESLEMLNARLAPADKLPEDPMPLRQAKPHLAPYLNGLLKTLKDPQWKLPAATSDKDAAKATRLHAMREMCDRYLDRLIEEDKPENQVDEEYKAKKNKVFMWQARRLFCQQHLRVFSQKDMSNKTDFMDFVRTVQGPPVDLTASAGADAAEEAIAGATAPGGTELPAEGAEGTGGEEPAQQEAAAPPTADVPPEPAATAEAPPAETAPASVPAEAAPAEAPAATAATAAAAPAAPAAAGTPAAAAPDSAPVAAAAAAAPEAASGDAAKGTKREAPAPAGTPAGGSDAERDAKKAKK